MKRIGYLHDNICSLDNIYLADVKARKHKTKRWGIIKHDKNKDLENKELAEKLDNLTYLTSEYDTFEIREPKLRIIYRLPYYPDRICHHAIMNIMEPIWTNIFIKHTYSCIKNRGIHSLASDLKKALIKYPELTVYCLKMDITKFYPSIDHDVLFSIIKKKVKDPKVLANLKEIIYSTDGVPIGNYLSQYFANLFLTYFDHWVKEELKCKFYYRYADDIVILSDNKEFLRNVLLAIKLYLKHVLKLKLKQNYQIFPVESRGIDFIGYKFYHTHILLRKSIKMKIFKLIHKFKSGKITKEDLKQRMLAYFGWLKFCNSKNLLLKIDLLTGIRFSNWKGTKVNITNFYNKFICVVDYVEYNTYFRVNFMYRNKAMYFESHNQDILLLLRTQMMPFNLKLEYYVNTKKNRN